MRGGDEAVHSLGVMMMTFKSLAAATALMMATVATTEAATLFPGLEPDTSVKVTTTAPPLVAGPGDLVIAGALATSMGLSTSADSLDFVLQFSGGNLSPSNFAVLDASFNLLIGGFVTDVAFENMTDDGDTIQFLLNIDSGAVSGLFTDGAILTLMATDFTNAPITGLFAPSDLNLLEFSSVSLTLNPAQVVPLPAGVLLLLSAMGGLALVRRRI